MRKAINLARKGAGLTSPNPMVGAVIVKNGSIVAENFHRKAGELHAERLAIERAQCDLSGTTLYVNLEPCCHFGKTPPCTDIIIKSGIKRVVIAAIDPFPKVSCNGIEILRASGVDVTLGVLENQAKILNEAYFKRIATGKPFVIYKSAMTIDGKIALQNGESQWITSEKSRKLAHYPRSKVDAILTGSGTVVRDDPSLNVRLKKKTRDPIPIIMDSGMKIPEDAKLFIDAPSRGTILFTSNSANLDKIKKLKDKGLRIIPIPEGKDPRQPYNKIKREKTIGENLHYFMDIEVIMQKIAELGISSVLLECGGNLAFSMLQKGLIDKLTIFIAPKIMGGTKSPTSFEGSGVEKLVNTFLIEKTKMRRIGADYLFEGYIKKQKEVERE
ncbi:bifunctional diaminohydroxyphosphoribosylaminopyrimidine deaminase/5-amino-6-(5-phosphoribosylamino)uracil reductase RibD [bacterium]|nr:bifunctional diaminohydroxyphosphoribosylaminopyrimidine deaminase/5-amino-6-(5-phosphoribosylamino)uracil reductase RibD [bacterium]